MKSTIKLIFAAAVVLLAACQKEETSAPSNFPKDGVIRIATNVELPATRAGMTADNLHMFSINIENAANATYNYFAFFDKAAGGTWSSYADAQKTTPLTMMWQNDTQPVTVTAVSRDGAPLEQKDFAETTMAVEPLQSDETYLKRSDILYMAPTEINPANGLTTDGELPVTFQHLLSKVNLSITLGTEFNIVPGTATNPIGELRINGTKRHFRWTPLKSSALQATGDKPAAIAPLSGAYTPGNGTATHAVAHYEAILVPQTVAAKGFSVSFTIDGKPYTWTSDAAVTLEQGQQHALALVVGKEVVTLGGFSAGAWTDGTEENKGTE